MKVFLRLFSLTTPPDKQISPNHPPGDVTIALRWKCKGRWCLLQTIQTIRQVDDLDLVDNGLIDSEEESIANCPTHKSRLVGLKEFEE